MTDIERAKELLDQEGYTAVLVREGEAIPSRERGIRPLVKWYRAGFTRAGGYSAADRVVGRGAAFLYLLLGVRELYAAVISRPALAVLAASGIAVSYATLADNIKNRAGDGICPFEEAVLAIEEPIEAYTAILRKMEALGISLPDREGREAP